MKSVRSRYPLIVNLALYQGLWFTAVLARERLEPVLLLILLTHLLLVSNRRSELKLMFWCMVIGMVADSALTWGGVFSFTPTPVPFPVPLWLVAIWLGFAATLSHSLNYLMKRPLLAMSAGALLAPLSYLGAGKLGAVNFPFGYLPTYLVLVPCWGVLMGLLIVVNRMVDVKGNVN